MKKLFPVLSMVATMTGAYFWHHYPSLRHASSSSPSTAAAAQAPSQREAAPSPVNASLASSPPQPSSPKAAESNKPEERMQVLAEACTTWIQGQENIFFNEQKYIDELLQKDTRIIETMGEHLLNIQTLLDIPEQEEMVSSTPELVRERMALIDMARATLHSQQVNEASKDLLIAQLGLVLKQRILPTYSNTAKRILLTEKRELLQLLVTYNQDRAHQIWQEIPQERVRVLLRQELSNRE
jgi:hypothetical protein